MFSPNKKIIIIDDSILNIKIIEKYLDNSYLELYSCTNSEESIQLIKKVNPDLILMDLYMPGMNGFDLLNELKKELKTSLIPVIFITSSQDVEDTKQAYKLGIIDYIRKPIIKEELLSKVHNYLFHIEEKKILERYVKIIDEYVLSIIIDINFIVLYISKAFCDKINSSKEEIYGSNLKDLTLHKKNDKIWENLEFALKNNKWHGKLLFKRKNDEPFWAETHIETIWDNYQNSIGFQIIAFDITEKLKLKELAIRDPLTKIYNRNKIIEFIDFEIQKSKRYLTNFSLIMIDIDDFKNINDTFGHNFGDVVLIEFTKIISSTVRKIDIIGRWGGEEFLIVLPQTNLKNSIKVAERLKQNFEKNIVTYNGISIPLNTASFGITEYKKKDTLNSIIERVDLSLYSSKKSGKNKITAN